jgi:putative peptidoglycan lipid II flippase
MLRKKIGAFGGKKLARVIFKIILSCIIMSAVVFALISVLSGFTFSVTLIDRAIKLIVPAGLGALVYFGSTYVLKIDEAVDVFNKLKAKALRHN